MLIAPNSNLLANDCMLIAPRLHADVPNSNLLAKVAALEARARGAEARVAELQTSFDLFMAQSQQQQQLLLVALETALDKMATERRIGRISAVGAAQGSMPYDSEAFAFTPPGSRQRQGRPPEASSWAASDSSDDSELSPSEASNESEPTSAPISPTPVARMQIARLLHGLPPRPSRAC